MATHNDLASQTARQILEIIPYVMRVMASEMRQYNPLVLPAHFRLLHMLAHRSWTLTELAKRHAVSAPTMSNTVTTLDERGWVTRVRSEEDRRVVVIQATEEGRRIIEETFRRAERHISTLLEPLDTAEQEALARGLTVMRQVFVSAIPAVPENDQRDIIQRDEEIAP